MKGLLNNVFRGTLITPKPHIIDLLCIANKVITNNIIIFVI